MKADPFALHWLFKEEPAHYSYDDLVKETRTSWAGVHNNLALKHLRNVKKDELIFFYHTGEERQIVGIMKSLSDAYATDGREIKSSKNVSVDVAPFKKLVRPVTLDAIKKDKRFEDFLLLKISRLSVMPVSEEQWNALRSLEES